MLLPLCLCAGGIARAVLMLLAAVQPFLAKRRSNDFHARAPILIPVNIKAAAIAIDEQKALEEVDQSHMLACIDEIILQLAEQSVDGGRSIPSPSSSTTMCIPPAVVSRMVT